MLNSVKKLLGDSQKRKIKNYEQLVNDINQLESVMETLSDDELRQKTVTFQHMLQNGKTVDDIKIEAFAVVREAAKRVLGLRHYDVQLIGGLVLLEGNIAEMPTGEGKTLVSSLPTYVRALEKKGVHVITVNDYLAKRDKELIGQVHEFLGLTVGLNMAQMESMDKKRAYEADITYGIGTEFGFDYLRDNMASSKSQQVQRPYHFAIIDEIDSVLIDEAKTPLIIAGKKSSSSDFHHLCAKVMKSFQDTLHYTYDAETKACNFTEDGITKIEDLFDIDNLYDIEHQTLYHYMIQALRAHVAFQLDVDYIIEDEKIMLVDIFTGRIMDGRSLSDGLHQALEAKEGLPITDENQTQASITIQNFFRMYPALSGMTGTAKTEEKEFNRVYNMEVISIPTNRPILREDKKDVVYVTADAKYKAVCAEVINIHKKKRPILIGTMSILQSEAVARYLDEANLPYQLLNAKSAEQEADLIALAGKKGKITIATNMAGRGTDILLEKGVHELGGLHVIGTERHESRRVDNQLKGRAGRQGDPGSSQFFLSLEDEMMQRYAGEEVEKLKKSLKSDENGLILNTKIYDLINRTQLICEGSHFSMREYNLKLDDVINDQRNVVYKLRNNLLNEEINMIEIVIPMIKNTLTVIAKDHLLEGMLPEEWDFTKLVEALKEVLSTEEIPALSANNVHSAEDLQELLKDTLTSYIERIKDLESNEDAQEVLRQISLHFLDSGWTNHLSAMQHLKEGIGLRQYQQEDPARLYQKEGFEIFLHTFSHFEKEVALYLARYINVPQNI
ncbi:accessory Sec system translocase SecA2 [Bacillus albus]|uniref:accessory Sec system translocase SecA2 n=1 Tax=Bacillus cereus group TaxID=86661 RepID=UPI0022E2E4EF|nr:MULTISPECIES: accessory Sec system translocase SecA2 [Bacillus cereus group]MDA2218368.1 accessory Sec system translocase SecA2 [Bacillus cereus group sp. Bc228]MDA2228668.1 accessory Sec system translocase SecA2 [Bacillus cereus group sp. Bc227]MDA2262748.1 accessory Sec system translocase SecA2 [Bacillus cereus group sp. Bc200]MDA2324200.1 accessory Sec system translocase SecA2 [Bacillus cereus group sp. Bc177]HDR7718621.1 accessory Sec system translocase SecA2 [Bacillus albus]